MRPTKIYRPPNMNIQPYFFEIPTENAFRTSAAWHLYIFPIDLYVCWYVSSRCDKCCSVHLDWQRIRRIRLDVFRVIVRPNHNCASTDHIAQHLRDIHGNDSIRCVRWARDSQMRETTKLSWVGEKERALVCACCAWKESAWKIQWHRWMCVFRLFTVLG